MMRRFLLLATMLVMPSLARAQDLGIQVGAKAPTAALETLDGKPAELGTYLGQKVVVLEFWATWCSSCKALEPKLRAALAKHGNDVAFVGVAVSVNQSQALVQRYAERHKLPGTVLYDRKGYASDAYEVPATSYIVVVGKDGLVKYTGVGGDQDIEAAIRKAL